MRKFGITMFSTYSDLTPIIILLTLVLSLIIGWNIPRENLRGGAGIFAVLGFSFGFFMTIMNLIYTSKDLFLLSPVIAISCVLYLRFRNKFKIRSYDLLLQISDRNNTILSIIWWFIIGAALLTYRLSDVYTRHPLFFFLISGAVTLLGIQIIASKCSNTTKTSLFIIKILLLSIILRYSAYFVSPYPIGSDPWEHKEYISYFIDFGRVTVPPDFFDYYVYYPIAHLYAACTALLGSISLHDTMFLLGVVLTFSTIVTFLIVRMLTENVQLALISMLLLNFTDVQILWSVQIIAMSFAIALYAFIIFFTLKIYSKPDDKNKFVPLLLVFLGIIVWTHTISAFITLVSLFALFVGYVLNEILYNKNIFLIQSRCAQILIVPLIFLTILILYHWMDPSYPFFDMIFGPLLKSFSQNAAFLGATTVSNVHGRWEELLQPVGFCMYVFLGIIGTLYCLSDKERIKKYSPLIVLVLVIFFVRYAFPILGMKNIIPDRWPAFAFISFALFVGLGFFCGISSLKKKSVILCAVAIFLFVGSFFMITNGFSNNDSPIYDEKVSAIDIWSESEMNMYSWINTHYNEKIIADVYTQQRPFKTYLKNSRSEAYKILPDGEIDTQFFSSGLVIWREISLDRPLIFSDGQQYVPIILDDSFRKYLNNNYSCISDAKTAKSYIIT